LRHSVIAEAGVQSGFDLQGHRGARGLWPENTLAGFANAVRLGVTSVEFDVALTADGVPVVTHDPRLSPNIARGSNGAWIVPPGPPVASLTLAALEAFDVGRLRPGSALAFAFRQQRPCDGARIPTLASVFALLAAAPVKLDAELKSEPDHPELTASPEAMAEAVIAAGAGGGSRLAVRSFDWRGLRYLRAHHPAVPLVWLTCAETNNALWWHGPCPGDYGGSVPRAVAAEAEGAGWPPVWAPDAASLSERDVAEAHELGLRVVPWTVNRPAKMVRLIGWGVDGICTDRPDRLRAVMAQAGLPLPEPFELSVSVAP
jgi:glycerophosphoryl diester phosphodiesterase